MKRKLSMILSLLLVVVLLAGCGGKNSSTDATKGGEETTDPADKEGDGKDETPEDGTGMDSWSSFEEKVKITVPVYDRSLEGYPAVDDNYWTKWIQTEFGDKYNIDVEYVAIPRNDVMTRYNLLILGEETPTIMMEYDYPKVAEWANDGAMATIDLDEFAKVAPTYYQKMVDNDQLNYTDLNGETYFVLSERPYYNANYTYYDFYRLDWVKELGLNPPTNYEEYSEIIDKVIEDGLTDIAPVGLGIPANAYVANFPYRDHPVDEAEWVQHSSLGTASLSWEATKKLLKRANEEYNKGWYSSEFEFDVHDGGAGSDSQMKTDFVNGKSFRYGGYMSSSVDWLTAFYENNPDAELGILDPNSVVEPGVVDQAINRADNPFGMIVGFSALATEDELTAAWMLMEWMVQEENLFTLENGIEGVTFEYDEDGVPVVDGDYRGDEMLNHNNNIDMTCLVHAAKTLGDVEQSIGQVSPKGLPQDFTDEMIATWKKNKEIADDGRAYSDPVFAVAIDSESEYSASLLSLYQEYYAQLVKCKPEEFDDLYKDLSKKYLDAGYQEVIDERLEAYTEGNTTKLPK